MRSALDDPQLRTDARRNGGDEVRSFRFGSTNLEMRIARAAQRAGAEQRTAEIRAAAAAPAENTLRRVLERAVRGIEDAGAVQDLVRMRAGLDVQLEPRRAVERVLLVGADLRVDVERPQQRESAARDAGAREVEM